MITPDSSLLFFDSGLAYNIWMLSAENSGYLGIYEGGFSG